MRALCLSIASIACQQDGYKKGNSTFCCLETRCTAETITSVAREMCTEKAGRSGLPVQIKYRKALVTVLSVA